MRTALPGAIKKHERTLISCFRQSIRPELFGTEDDSQWQKHIDTFLRAQVAPETKSYENWRNGSLGREAAALIDRSIRNKVTYIPVDGPNQYSGPEQLTPIEYERYCADSLENLGWTVQMTPATRDHGADIVADMDQHRLVIQCKRYAQPVGNKAVQEAYSALYLYNGTVACVVAPTGFTAQAQREAHGLGIHLLHHGDLEALTDKLKQFSRQLPNNGARVLAGQLRSPTIIKLHRREMDPGSSPG